MKKFGIVLVLYVVGIGSIFSSVYHIYTKLIGPGEWVTIMAVTVQLILVTILYPWKELKTAGTLK